jgi:DNA-binding transcriptional regulator YiaG
MSGKLSPTAQKRIKKTKINEIRDKRGLSQQTPMKFKGSL